MKSLVGLVCGAVVAAMSSCAGGPAASVAPVVRAELDASVAFAPIDAAAIPEASPPMIVADASDPPREPQMIANGLDPIEAIALDESDAYILTRSAPGAWRLYRIAKRGGVAARLDDFHAESVSVAVDDHAFYIATAQPISEAIQGGNFRTSAYGRVVVAPKVGGGRATIFDGLRAAYGVAVHGENVYWLSGAVDGSGGVTVDSIMKGRTSGGGATHFAMKQIGATSVTADGTAVYFAVAGRFDDRKHAWPAGAILRAAISGGAPSTLAATAEQPHAIALDDAAVYWIDRRGALSRVAKSGGPAALVADKVERFALDGARVYAASGGVITARAKSGGDVVARWESAAPVTAIAIDGAFVYFASGGELRRAPK